MTTATKKNVTKKSSAKHPASTPGNKEVAAPKRTMKNKGVVATPKSTKGKKDQAPTNGITAQYDESVTVPRGTRKVKSGKREFTLPVKAAAVLKIAQKSKTPLGKIDLLVQLAKLGFRFGPVLNAGSSGGINNVCEYLSSLGYVTRSQPDGTKKVIEITPLGAAVEVLDSI